MSEHREEAAARGGSPPAPPLPRRIDLEHAFRVYVAGRNRMWTEDQKRSAAVAAESGASGPVEDGPPAALAPSAARPHAGVPVPERLAYHRSAGTWRNLVPGGRRRPD